MADFYILITDAGAALEAAAHAAGEPLVLTAFAVCDGGAAFTPEPTLTALANEVYRGDISSLAVSADDPAVLVAQCIIPASSGGYTIRGIGIYAGDTLYAVGNYPDQPKPAPDTGYAASLEILAQLAVSDTADVTLNVTDGAWLTKEEGDQLYVPLQRKINGHDLTADLTLTPADVDAVPSGRTVNGHPLTADVVVTPWDIYGGAVQLGDVENLNDITTPGLYFQPSDHSAANGSNYPEPSAGSLEVKKAAGIIQVYTQYRAGRTYTRTFYGDVWSEWARNYDTVAKPTGDDTNSITRDFCRVAGFVAGDAESPYMRHADSEAIIYLARRDYVDGNFATVAWVNGNGFATAEWVGLNFANKPNWAAGGNGWFHDPTTGMYLQWCLGGETTGDATQLINFPVAFPNACLFASVSTLNPDNNANCEQNYQMVNWSNASCNVMPNLAYGSHGRVAPLIFAVGY